MTTEFDLDSKYVLSFGVLSPRKNLELLVQAMSEVSASAPDWTLVIAGGEPEYYEGYGETLADVARTNGIGDEVVFTGYLNWDTADEVYANADLYAHTPEYRVAASGPISTAISHHLPILVSDIPVFRELFNHRENGYLVSPRLEPLSDGLHKLMHDPTLQKTLRDGTFNLAERLSWAEIARETLEEYRSLVDEH